MKYSRTAIGLLTAQYRSVLKKCLMINLGLFALGAVATATPANAATITERQVLTAETTLDDPVANGIENNYVGGVIHSSAKLIINNGSFENNKSGAASVLYDNSLGKESHSVTITGSEFKNNQAGDFGGVAIFSAGSSVTNSTFTGNKATANYDNLGDGAGALFLGSESQTVISGSTFTENSSGTIGGAIATRPINYWLDTSYSGRGTNNSSGAKADILSSTFTNNVAGTRGGAFFNSFYNSANKEGFAYIGNSTFNTNSANLGGAIFNEGWEDAAGNHAKLYIADTNFTGNTASEQGGAIYNESIMTIAANAANVAFSGNKANGVANDIFNLGTLTLDAAKGKTISLAGGIDGNADSKGTTNVSGAGSVKVANALKNQKVTNTGNLELDGASLEGTTIAGDGSVKVVGDSTMEGTNSIAKDLEIEAEQELALNNATINGGGTLKNLAGGTLNIKDSTINVKVNNAGVMYSDPSIYGAEVVNSGTATFENDTFENGSSLTNSATVNLINTTFVDGSTLTGQDGNVLNLVSGTSAFNGTSSGNNVFVANGANFSGSLTGGSVNTQNGVIDAINGSVSGSALSIDANLKGAGSVDTFGGSSTGTIKSVNIIDSEYGTADHLDLTLADGLTLANDAKITGNSYYTKVAQDGNKITFSDKLVNQSKLEDYVGVEDDGEGNPTGLFKGVADNAAAIAKKADAFTLGDGLTFGTGADARKISVKTAANSGLSVTADGIAVSGVEEANLGNTLKETINGKATLNDVATAGYTKSNIAESDTDGVYTISNGVTGDGAVSSTFYNKETVDNTFATQAALNGYAKLDGTNYDSSVLAGKVGTQISGAFTSRTAGAFTPDDTKTVNENIASWSQNNADNFANVGTTFRVFDYKLTEVQNDINTALSLKFDKANIIKNTYEEGEPEAPEVSDTTVYSALKTDAKIAASADTKANVALDNLSDAGQAVIDTRADSRIKNRIDNGNGTVDANTKVYSTSVTENLISTAVANATTEITDGVTEAWTKAYNWSKYILGVEPKDVKETQLQTALNKLGGSEEGGDGKGNNIAATSFAGALHELDSEKLAITSTTAAGASMDLDNFGAEFSAIGSGGDYYNRLAVSSNGSGIVLNARPTGTTGVGTTFEVKSNGVFYNGEEVATAADLTDYAKLDDDEQDIVAGSMTTGKLTLAGKELAGVKQAAITDNGAYNVVATTQAVVGTIKNRAAEGTVTISDNAGYAEGTIGAAINAHDALFENEVDPDSHEVTGKKTVAESIQDALNNDEQDIVAADITADTLTAGTLTLPNASSSAAAENLTVSGIKTTVAANPEGETNNYLVTSDGVAGIIGVNADGTLQFVEAEGVQNIAKGDGTKSAPTTVAGAISNLSSALGKIHGLANENGTVNNNESIFKEGKIASTVEGVTAKYGTNLKPGTSVEDLEVSLDNAIGKIQTGETVVGKAYADQNGAIIDTTYAKLNEDATFAKVTATDSVVTPKLTLGGNTVSAIKTDAITSGGLTTALATSRAVDLTIKLKAQDATYKPDGTAVNTAAATTINGAILANDLVSSANKAFLGELTLTDNWANIDSLKNSDNTTPTTVAKAIQNVGNYIDNMGDDFVKTTGDQGVAGVKNFSDGITTAKLSIGGSAEITGVDDAPTSGSNNLLSSGTIYSQLQGKQDTINATNTLNGAYLTGGTVSLDKLATTDLSKYDNSASKFVKEDALASYALTDNVYSKVYTDSTFLKIATAQSTYTKISDFNAFKDTVYSKTYTDSTFLKIAVADAKYATAAQGAKAETALQPTDIKNTIRAVTDAENGVIVSERAIANALKDKLESANLADKSLDIDAKTLKVMGKDVLTTDSELNGAKLANGSVGTAALANGAVTTEKLSDSLSAEIAKIADKADASKVYNKEFIDTALNGKANKSDLNEYAKVSAVYGKDAVDAKLAEKANVADVYGKTAVDSALAGKADKSEVYNKDFINTALDAKANKSEVVAKTDIVQTIAATGGAADKVASEAAIVTALSGKQNTIDADHKLNVDYINFSESQTAALNSGIKAEDVAQIGKIGNLAQLPADALTNGTTAPDTLVQAITNLDTALNNKISHATDGIDAANHTWTGRNTFTQKVTFDNGIDVTGTVKATNVEATNTTTSNLTIGDATVSSIDKGAKAVAVGAGDATKLATTATVMKSAQNAEFSAATGETLPASLNGAGTIHSAIVNVAKAVDDNAKAIGTVNFSNAKNIAATTTDLTSAAQQLDNAIGNRTYTNDNVIEDGESVAESLDKIDTAMGKLSDITADYAKGTTGAPANLAAAIQNVATNAEAAISDAVAGVEAQIHGDGTAGSAVEIGNLADTTTIGKVDTYNNLTGMKVDTSDPTNQSVEIAASGNGSNADITLTSGAISAGVKTSDGKEIGMTVTNNGSSTHTIAMGETGGYGMTMDTDAGTTSFGSNAGKTTIGEGTVVADASVTAGTVDEQYNLTKGVQMTSEGDLTATKSALIGSKDGDEVSGVELTAEGNITASGDANISGKATFGDATDATKSVTIDKGTVTANEVDTKSLTADNGTFNETLTVGTANKGVSMNKDGELTATGLASLDGGINVNDRLTVDARGNLTTAGAGHINGGLTVGDNFKVNTKGKVTAAQYWNNNDTFRVNEGGELRATNFKNNDGSFSVSTHGAITGSEYHNANDSFTVSSTGNVKGNNFTATGNVTAKDGTVTGKEVVANEGLTLANTRVTSIDTGATPVTGNGDPKALATTATVMKSAENAAYTGTKSTEGNTLATGDAATLKEALSNVNAFIGKSENLSHNAFNTDDEEAPTDLTGKINTLATNVAAGMGGAFDENGKWSTTLDNTWTPAEATDETEAESYYSSIKADSLADAINVVYSTIGNADAIKQVAYNGVSADKTVNDNIAAVNGKIGNFEGLHTELKNLTNGTDVAPETVVEAFNNIDATLGRIHGLFDGKKVNTTGGIKSTTGSHSNLAEGTTVEMHLVSLDNAIGDRSSITNEKAFEGEDRYDLVARTNVADVLSDIASQIGTADELKGATINGVSSDNTVNANIAAINSSLGNIEELKEAAFAQGDTLVDAVKNVDNKLVNLDTRLTKTEKSLKELHHDFRRGMASMAAMSALVPNSRSTGKTSLSIGTGAYGGHSAVAVGGFHYITDNLMLNAGVSWSDSSDAAYRMGVTYSF